MPRVKRGVTARARHKKVLALAKGFRGRRGDQDDVGTGRRGVRHLNIQRDLQRPGGLVLLAGALAGRRRCLGRR